MKRNLVEAFLSNTKKRIPKGFDTEIITFELDLLEEKPTSFLVSWVKDKTSYSNFKPDPLSYSLFDKTFSTNAILRIEKEFSKCKAEIEIHESLPEDSPMKYCTISSFGIAKESAFSKKNDIDRKIINILIDYTFEQFNFSQIQGLIEHKKISKKEKEIEYLKAIQLLEFPDNKYKLAIQSNVLELLINPFESEISSDENSYYSKPDFYPFKDEHVQKVIEYLTLKLKKAEDLKSLLSEDFGPTLNLTLEQKDLQTEIKDSSNFSETTLVPPKEVEVKKKNNIKNSSTIKTEGFYGFNLNFSELQLKKLYSRLVESGIILTKNRENDFVKAFNGEYISDPDNINVIKWKSNIYLAIFLDDYIENTRTWKTARILFGCSKALQDILIKTKEYSKSAYSKKQEHLKKIVKEIT
jgi:hypothetical protein